ncbi:MAG: YlmC/YmxH family sporulation protein [Clostridia bacterium]|nr:YlmC/YmxH family sporulation protein [Clostridia bacterium]MBR6504674.1 YlmC/YmxH family sporulation protein [Clostridia bacterium]
MSRGIDFRQKEVIDIVTGKILGFVVDVDAEFNAGAIKNIVVAQTANFFRSMTGKNNITIPWNKIKLIGEDVILVELN